MHSKFNFFGAKHYGKHSKLRAHKLRLSARSRCSQPCIQNMNGSSCRVRPPTLSGLAVFAVWGLHPNFVGPQRADVHGRQDASNMRPARSLTGLILPTPTPSISPLGDCTQSRVGPRWEAPAAKRVAKEPCIRGAKHKKKGVDYILGAGSAAGGL